jgi:hypothetical protein
LRKKIIARGCWCCPRAWYRSKNGKNFKTEQTILHQKTTTGAKTEQNKLVQEKEQQNRARQHGIFLFIITIGLDHKSVNLYQ